MEKLSKLMTWPMVALLIGGGVVFALTAVFAPPDVREVLFGANGLLSTVIAYWLRSPREMPPPPPPPPPPAVLLTLAVTLLALSSAACGASDALRAAYAEEVARCTLNEREIVARQGTTEEEDAAALAMERARCDDALRAVEGSGR